MDGSLGNTAPMDTAPTSMALGTLWGGAERLQETEYQEIHSETIVSRKGCINQEAY